jgi:hypothetical protein
MDCRTVHQFQLAFVVNFTRQLYVSLRCKLYMSINYLNIPVIGEAIHGNAIHGQTPAKKVH